MREQLSLSSTQRRLPLSPRKYRLRRVQSGCLSVRVSGALKRRKALLRNVSVEWSPNPHAGLVAGGAGTLLSNCDYATRGGVLGRFPFRLGSHGSYYVATLRTFSDQSGWYFGRI